MATTLTTVADFVAAAREFLQDNIVEYRYGDNDILLALNNGLQEAIRIRQILFHDVNYVVPTYTVVDSTPVAFAARHKPALLYYITGFVQLRDGDGDNDARAASLVKQFREQLVGNA